MGHFQLKYKRIYNLKRSKYLWWGFLVMVFGIPISQFTSARILLLVLIFSFFIGNIRVKFYEAYKLGWDLGFYLLVLIGGLIYSENLALGISVIETSFSFLAFPIVFAAIRVAGNFKAETLFYSFSCGTLVACVIVFINANVQFVMTSDKEAFMYYNLTEIIGLQPTYLAYYLIFSITYGVHLLYYDTSGFNSLVMGFLILFMVLILTLTGGHTTFISLIFIISFFVLKYLLDKRTLKKTYVISLVLIILIGLLSLSSMDYFKSLFSSQNDYWERSVLWRSAIEANPNPLFGVGTGDYKEALNAYYNSHGMVEFAEGSYNSHNQFIQLYFSNGIFGLFVLVLIVARPLYLSFKNQFTLGILLFFPFVIYGMTEVFLGRYQGVVFFVLLHQIIISHYHVSKQQSAFNIA